MERRNFIKGSVASLTGALLLLFGLQEPEAATASRQYALPVLVERRPPKTPNNPWRELKGNANYERWVFLNSKDDLTDEEEEEQSLLASGLDESLDRIGRAIECITLSFWVEQLRGLHLRRNTVTPVIFHYFSFQEDLSVATGLSPTVNWVYCDQNQDVPLLVEAVGALQSCIELYEYDYGPWRG